MLLSAVGIVAKQTEADVFIWSLDGAGPTPPTTAASSIATTRRAMSPGSTPPRLPGGSSEIRPPRSPVPENGEKA